MNNELIRQLGLEQLETIGLKYTNVREWKTWLSNYQFNTKYPDDRYVWLTCVLALKAVGTGNFGVGCILINAEGNIVAWGHNEVFNPYFRSNRHAEMVVMDKFEDSYQGITSRGGYTLYTSLESCPMCLARLITSGINIVLYAAPDKDGGMVHKMNDLPPTWIDLASRNIFSQAECSQDMINAATQIFLVNAIELNWKLKNR
jgi:cytosine deaminase